MVNIRSKNFTKKMPKRAILASECNYARSLIKKLAQDEFRRLTGVKPTTFEAMVVVLKEAD